MTLRPKLVLLHRYVGLAMAPFLFIAGLTGAVIAWQQELDEWLNPQFFVAASQGAPLPALELARRIEAADDRVQISRIPLALKPGKTFVAWVQPRLDPSNGKPYNLDYNQIAADPVSGAIQGKRQWGAISLARENLMPFLYRLHYTLHLPHVMGIQLGIWLMGLVAIGWVLDCFVSLSISFPNLNAWRKSLAFRWREGGYRLNFDLHRSGGVWIWLLLLVLAVTSVSMNLQQQVVRPVVSLFSELTPSPFANRARTADKSTALSREQILEQAQKEAQRRGISAPPGGMFLFGRANLYGVGFFEPGNERGSGGLGNPWLYFDAGTGAPSGSMIPGTGTNGDIFMQAMFPLHSGRMFGLPGRIAISLLGLVIAMLCVTGVVIWIKKRRSRLKTNKNQAAKSLLQT